MGSKQKNILVGQNSPGYLHDRVTKDPAIKTNAHYSQGSII